MRATSAKTSALGVVARLPLRGSGLLGAYAPAATVRPRNILLAKSYRNFTPVGPWLTTADEAGDPNDLNISCSVNDIKYQDSTTGDMIFRVPEIVSYLSTIIELPAPVTSSSPGSPHGVGQGQTPPLFLKPGDRVVTAIERLGQIENHAV